MRRKAAASYGCEREGKRRCCSGRGAGAECDLVSVIIPAHNAAAWIEQALRSVAAQTYRPIEVSVVDDASTDATAEVVRGWKESAEKAGVSLVFGCKGAGASERQTPGGAAAARNAAIAQSSGVWICFLDADDLMAPTRVEKQMALARALMETEGLALCDVPLIGCDFWREPRGSTARYTEWLRSLCQEDLSSQRFKECTLIQSTWFVSRAAFEAVGWYRADGGKAEDLDWFYRWFDRAIEVERGNSWAAPVANVANVGVGAAKQERSGSHQRGASVLLGRGALLGTATASDEAERKEQRWASSLVPWRSKGGCVRKVEEELVMYRYHGEKKESLTWATPPQLVWDTRLQAIARQLLLASGGEPAIEAFSIWGAGRDGKRFCRQLLATWPQMHTRLKMLLDVDERKVKHGVFDFEQEDDGAGNAGGVDDEHERTGMSNEGKEKKKKEKKKKKKKKKKRIRVPIVHFLDERAKAPAIVLVKGGGLHPGLEDNLEAFCKAKGFPKRGKQFDSRGVIFFN